MEECPPLSCVIEGRLYVGSDDAREAALLEGAGIQTVISIQQHWEREDRDLAKPHLARLPAHIAEHEFYFYDRVGLDISAELVACVHLIRASPGPCLVHCTAGMSRSVTIVTAYLMATEGLAFIDAYTRVREARPIAAINLGFQRLLYDGGDWLEACKTQ